MTPLFIFSLPRSGSTLLQRVCAAHPDVATVAEPWVLLPFLYTLKKRGVYTDYGHYLLYDALKEFCAELPNGVDDYLQEMQLFVLNLYDKAAKNNERYFLDKSPRYHLIAEEVVRLFPDGKFILLWRNPLAIIASLIETFGGKKWNIFRHKVDIYDGLCNLIDLHQQYSDNLIVIRYEDVLKDPEKETKRICAMLDIEWMPELIDSFSDVKFKGRFGDPTGQKEYQSVSTAPLEKWKGVIINPWRKWWCKRYLRWLGAERLQSMGYSLQELLTELDAVPSSTKMLISDLLMATYGIFYCAFEPDILRQKVKKLPEWKWVRKHD